MAGSEFPASSRQRNFALGLAALITVVALATLPFVRVPAPVITAFIPVSATAIIILDLLTALLFMLQFSRNGRPSTLLLGCAYLFTGSIVVPYLLVFPGLFLVGSSAETGSQSAAWLWLFWHAGFPGLILAHALALKQEQTTAIAARWPASRLLPAVVATLLLSTILTAIATLGHDLLPTVIRHDNYQPPSVLGIGLVLCLLNLAALIALWRTARDRTVTQLWLVVAMLAFLLDTAISLAAGARFNAGWYLARMNSLLCAGAVLGAFMFEFHRLQSHLSVVNRRLAELADTDVLTGLGNRRAFDRQLDLELARASRNKEPLALLLLDIDHFKTYNDCYGHQAGDLCLQQVAAAIRGTLKRPADFAARYGGEELAIILPQTGYDSALLMAQKLCDAVRGLDIKHRDAVTGCLTCSMGLAVTTPETGELPAALFARTDAALYRAKHGGRDQVRS